MFCFSLPLLLLNQPLVMQGRAADSGHYIGFGKIADGRWIQYDDHRVQEMKVAPPYPFRLYVACVLTLRRRMPFSGLTAALATAPSHTFAFTRRRSWPQRCSDMLHVLVIITNPAPGCTVPPLSTR